MGKDQTSADGVVLKTPNIDEHSNIDPEKSSQGTVLKSLGKNSPPIVIVPLSNVRITEVDSVILKAKIDGNPKPKVF